MPRSRAHAPAPEARETASQATPPEPEVTSPGTLAFALALGELAPDGPASALGPGVPLPLATRRRMEAIVGGSLAGVRVHADAAGARLAFAQRAAAVTAGQHVAFAPGRYAPGTLAGEVLLAHELAHTRQQAGVR